MHKNLNKIKTLPVRERLDALSMEHVEEHISAGNSVRDLCLRININSRHFYEWLAKKYERIYRYISAFYDGAEYLEEEAMQMLRAAENNPVASNVRLQIAIADRLERRADNRRKYGDRRLLCHANNWDMLYGIDSPPDMESGNQSIQDVISATERNLSRKAQRELMM